MDHIFISYSRKDEEQVAVLVEELRKAGFEIWQDVSGKRSGIPYSVKWFEVIKEAVYAAAGAVIFKSEAWEHSGPCQKEFELIRETDLPFMYVAADSFFAVSQEVVDETVGWCREQIFLEENGYCKWMRSGAYRTGKGLPVESYYYPMGKHLFRNWRWIRKCCDMAGNKNFHGEWVKDLYAFLAKAKRKIMLNISVRIILSVIFLSMWVWAMSAGKAIQMTMDTNQSLSTESAAVSEIRRAGGVDPISAIQMIEMFGAAKVGYVKGTNENERGTVIDQSQEERLENLGASNFYFMTNRVLTELVSKNYPVAFYETAAECPEEIFGMAGRETSSRYAVTLSKDTTQIFIYDKELDITRQLLLAAVPESYCFSENEDRLIIAAADKVYVYDLYGEAYPALLSYNFEDIKDLFMNENKIYAVTEKDHVVVWNDPLQERKISDTKISAGCMAQSEDGQVMAVYMKDGSLTVNINNEEKSYPLSFEGTVNGENIALSPDQAYAAVSYKPYEGGNDWIGVVALSDGEVKEMYDTGNSIEGFIFSSDGMSIVVTCYDKYKIVRIDLETGEIQESYEETFSNPYTIIEYGGQFLVCDIVGMLSVYDSALKRTGNYRVIGCAAPQKQLAVSEKYDSLLAAGRGGNMPSGNIRTWLSSDKRAFFLAVESEPMIATTSVAVTKSGEYAAFGNAGGSIYLWDIGSMDRVRDIHSVPEGVVKMLFSEDSLSLYVLGSSGTAYTVSMEGVLDGCVPAYSRSIWLRNMEEAEVIKDSMYDLGLFICE